MNRISQFSAMFLVTLVCSAIPALAQQRIALVVGNSNYTNIQSLPNPANDSKLMAQTLRKLDFEVVAVSDADFIGMRRAVKEFGRKLRVAGKEAVGLFYYAGHGVQAQGSNFLIPLGAEVTDEADLEIEAISASDVLAQMEAAGNTLNMVILDACRNNPYKAKSRSNSRGLARVNAASGSLVAFAAAPGQVAADGAGDNSPYTKALIKAMQIPGLSIEQMFKKVRVSVEVQTNNQQTPWEESSLRGEFYFNPVSAPLANNENTHPQVLSQVVLDNSAAQTEALFWKSVKDSNDPNVFAAYLETYPKGTFAGLARVLMKNLRRYAKPASADVTAGKNKQVVASLQPSVAPPPPSAAPSTSLSRVIPPQPLTQKSVRERTLILQRELTRLGCQPGRIDGKWGPKGRRALTRFKRYAGLALPFDDLSTEVIEAAQQQSAKVCPITVRAERPRTLPAVKSKPKPAPQSTYGVQNKTKKEWQDCVIDSMVPNPIVSSEEC